MTEKSFAAGSEFPELAADKLRLYSMRFCPYAQRTRLVLDHLKIPHEVVNVNLKSKPDWFLARNPFGLVPVLEQYDKVVYESAVCDEYLVDAHGGKGLIPSDPYVKAREKILMETNSKITDKFYGLFRGTDDDKNKKVEELQKALNFVESSLTGKYLGGDHPSLLDLHVWPWFERLPMLEKLADVAIISEEKFPQLSAWMKTMHELPAVQATRFSDDEHLAFVKSFLGGGMPDYDMGL